MSAAEDTARQDAWHSVETSFAALGRAVLILDAAYHVLQASYFLDTFVCEGTRDRLLGRSVSDLLGSRLFVPGDALHRALSQGHRAEGRRAFIKCPRTGAQLVSLSVAPLPGPDVRVLHDRARFIVVIRPADAPGLPNEMDDALLARSPGMLQIVSMVEALSESEATVLITGESGTGKEVVARAIHAHSPRASGPFVAVNTGAIPGPLLESELFGHVRGAFTGAIASRIGRFEAANGGTVFLDEIGDISPAVQTKLLRVLQEKEFERVGDNRPIKVDVRFIAATNCDLSSACASGNFRRDLFYRLAVIPIQLPSLRERRDDIPMLVDYFLERLNRSQNRSIRGVEPAAMQLITSYTWPGNVRELENAIEYAFAVTRGDTITRDCLPAHLSDNPHPLPSSTPCARRGARTPSKERLREVLHLHEGNRTRAAEYFGVSRVTLWKWLKRSGIDGA